MSKPQTITASCSDCYNIAWDGNGEPHCKKGFELNPKYCHDNYKWRYGDE